MLPKSDIALETREIWQQRVAHKKFDLLQKPRDCRFFVENGQKSTNGIGHA
jgi:hypothetical protein